MKIVESNGSIQFTVRVVPRASKSEIVGHHDGALKVKIASPPVDGAANAELIKLLARSLNVPKTNVVITSGRSSKTKQVSIFGIDLAAIASILKGKS